MRATPLFLAAFWRSYHHEVDEFMDRRRLQALLIHAQLEDRLLLLGREAPRQVALELLDQERHAFLAPALVADRVFDQHLRELLPVLELDGEAIGDGALLRIEVVAAELLVL